MTEPTLQPSHRAKLEYEGARLAPLVIDRRWIYRRVDSVTFRDHANRVRSVKVDLCLPDALHTIDEDYGGARGDGFHYVPLTLVGKRSPTNFDFTSDDGSEVTLLPAKERIALATGVLMSVAAVAVGSERARDLRQEFRIVAGLDTQAAATAVDRVFAETGWPEVPSRRWLLFRAVAEALAENFLAVLPLVARGTRHRSISFSYNERRSRVYRHTTRSVFLRSTVAAARSLGWRPKRIWLLTPAVGQGGTYHLRVNAPDGLKFTAGALIPLAVDQRTRETRAEPPIAASRSHQEPHVYVRDLPLASSGVAWFDIRARGATVVRAAWLTALATALILGLGSLSVSTLTDPTNAAGTQAAATLLLIIPTIAAAYVARPSEHHMTTSIVFGVRFLTLVSGAASFGAACVLALSARGTLAQVAWDACAVIAILVSVALTLTTVQTLLEGQSARNWLGRKLAPPDTR
jgi:hypothetical protein